MHITTGSPLVYFFSYIYYTTFLFFLCDCTIKSSGGSKGRQGRTPRGFKFFHFHAVFGQKVRLAHPLWELAPLPPPPPRKILNPSLKSSSFCIEGVLVVCSSCLFYYPVQDPETGGKHKIFTVRLQKPSL